ncbi:MAG: 50S ribosomal protein L25 [Myxococcota bacterium]
MEMQSLLATVRTSRGKGSSRKLRAHGQMPGVLYGPGIESTALTVTPEDVVRILSTEYRRNAVIQLKLDTRQEFAVVKDLDVHPVTQAPVHVDFLRVEMDQEMVVEVPVRTHGRALGVQMGGKLNVPVRSMRVRAKPSDIPASLTIDVTSLKIGEMVEAGEVSLPDGVSLEMKSELRIVLVTEDRRATAEARKASEGEEAKS